MWRDMWAPGIAKKERTPESRWHKSTWSFANVHAQEGHDVCSHCTRLSFNALQHMTFFLWNVKDQRLIVIVPVGDTGNRLVWTVLVSKGWRGRRQTTKTYVMCDRAANEAACRMAPGLLTGVVQGHIDSVETTADSNSFQIKRQRFDWLARGDGGKIWPLHTGNQNDWRKEGGRPKGVETTSHWHPYKQQQQQPLQQQQQQQREDPRDPERPRTDSCDVVASSRPFDGDAYSVPQGNTCSKNVSILRRRTEKK